MNTTDYRDRFGFSHHPFDKEFLHHHPLQTQALEHIERRCAWLLSLRGVGVYTGLSGVGKTAALAHVLKKLASHRYKIVYIEDSGASVSDIFRHIAYELNLQPAFRRATLWRDLKGKVTKLHEEQDQQVILVLDDAHLLPSSFLKSLGAFMNFAFDSRELLTVWLVGDSHLLRLLSLDTHHHLATRVRLRLHLEPLEHDEFATWVNNCLNAAGCTRQIVSDTGISAAYSATRGVPRNAAHLFDYALRLCHEQNRDIVCENIIEQAMQEVML